MLNFLLSWAEAWICLDLLGFAWRNGRTSLGRGHCSWGGWWRYASKAIRTHLKSNSLRKCRSVLDPDVPNQRSGYRSQGRSRSRSRSRSRHGVVIQVVSWLVLFLVCIKDWYGAKQSSAPTLYGRRIRSLSLFQQPSLAPVRSTVRRYPHHVQGIKDPDMGQPLRVAR